MAPATPSQRRARLRGLCAIAASCSIAANAAASATVPDQCIVSDRAIGCITERATIDLATPRKDAGAMRDLVRQKLDSGQCRLFGYGERVTLISSSGTDRSAIRRVGDRTTYWLPASWTRPASECEANASSASLQGKIGMPDNALSQQSADAAQPEEIYRDDNVDRGDYAYRDDDDRAYRNDVYPRNGDAYRNDVAPGNSDTHRYDVRSNGDTGRNDYAYRSRAYDRDARDRYQRKWDRRNPAYSRDGYADERSYFRDDGDHFPRDERLPSDDHYPPPRGLPPQHAPAPLASSSYAHMHPDRDSPRSTPCVYKPVMTREDLAACRTRER